MLRSLPSRVIAGAGAGLLTLTAIMNSAFAYGHTAGAVAPTAVEMPVQLASYTDTIGNAASDAAGSSYSSLFSSLPSLPPLILGLNIPGVFDAFDNVTGVLPWDFSFGVTIGNAGGLGVEAWAPDNPLFSLVAESMGTTSGAWPGVASLIGVETLLGGFTNTESYANVFDPTGTTCLICDTFSLLGPGNTGLFSWTTNIPIGGLPQFELSTPLFSWGPDLGNAFDYSPLANGLVGDPTAALSTLAASPAPALTDIANTLGTALTGYSAALPTDIANTLSATLSSYIAALPADVANTLGATMTGYAAALPADIVNALLPGIAANISALVTSLLPLIP
jgi:hypothetical protein